MDTISIIDSMIDQATQEYEQADLARAPKTLAEAKALWAAQDAAKSKK
mgnify:CR=1 FL=1